MIYFKGDNVDEKELLDKLDKIIKQIDDLEAKVIEISKENAINNSKIEKLIENNKKRIKKHKK